MGTELIQALTIFVLALFLGYEVITKVPPTLHTPLMSGTNAISGIAIAAALGVAAQGGALGVGMGIAAIILATINVVGGFAVTDRMLSYFHSSKAK